MTNKKYDLSNLSVFIAMPVKGSIPTETVLSLLNTVGMLSSKGIPHVANLITEGALCEARSKAAKAFLESGATKMLFIDSDMVWTHEDVLRILALSTAMPIVVAPYTSRTDPPKFYVKMDRNEAMLNEHGCAAVDGVGLGFAAIDRCVIQDLSDKASTIKYADGEVVPYLFRFDVFEGQFRGEDVAFFDDAKKLGYQCWLDLNASVGHLGKKVFKENILDHFTINKEAEAA